MKEIDESFFKQDGKAGRQAKDFLRKGEKILWKGIPKVESYVYERLKSHGVNPYVPVLMLVDFVVFLIFEAIFSIPTSGLSWIALIIYIIIHANKFFPYMVVRKAAYKSVYVTEYIITNKRIFELRGTTKYVNFSADFSDIIDIRYKQEDADKKFNTADIYISTPGNKHVMHDIPNGLFIFEKLDTLYRMKLEEAEEFYAGSNICTHCNSYFDKDENKCPNCGAPKE